MDAVVKLYGREGSKNPEHKFSPPTFCGVRVVKIKSDPERRDIALAMWTAKT